MNEYINIYKDNPTKGTKDGTLVSQNSLQTDPVTTSLDANNNEVKYLKCAIRTEKGFKSSRTAISFTGLTKEKWKVALDDGFTETNVATEAKFSSTLVIDDIVTDTNTIIWFRIASSSDEQPRRDISVSIKIDSYIEAV